MTGTNRPPPQATQDAPPTQSDREQRPNLEMATPGSTPPPTAPREMREVEPTLAPLVLASGLAVTAVGVLVHQGGWALVLGALWALSGGVMWALAALKESR